MRLFFDRRLGYFVTAPGQDSALTDLEGKAGDTVEVQVVFGRSSDPTGASSIVDAPTWTPENLPGGSVITIAIKEDGLFGDGALLAGTSTFSLNSGAFTYTFSLPLNTEAINDALFRLDDDDENDLETLPCKFELTFQSGGSGGWQSSILPVSFTIYNDLIGGSEGTPVNADDPDEYLLKASGYEWLPTVTSKTGGTSADLDAIPTVSRPTGGVVAFKDTDSSLNKVRLYRLETGTNAESEPQYIRPDDFNASTNAKVWVFLPQVSDAITDPTTATGDILYRNSGGNLVALPIGATNKVLKVTAGIPAWETDAGGISDLVEDTTPQLGGPLDANAKQIRESKGADVASASNLAIGNDGNFFVVTGTTTIATIASKGIGTEVTLQFSGALILTHSADLVLPTAANITTEAGDIAKFRGHASGAWRCVSYLRANGQALAVASSSSDPNQLTGVNTITGTQDLGLSDIGKLCLVDTTIGAITLTIPLQSTVTWPANAILRVGHTVNEFDLVTINVASGGELRNSANEPNVTLSIGEIVTIYRVASNTWRVIGSN